MRASCVGLVCWLVGGCSWLFPFAGPDADGDADADADADSDADADGDADGGCLETPCDDGDPCTEGDVTGCAGGCQGLPIQCPPMSVCDPATGGCGCEGGSRSCEGQCFAGEPCRADQVCTVADVTCRCPVGAVTCEGSCEPECCPGATRPCACLQEQSCGDDGTWAACPVPPGYECDAGARGPCDAWGSLDACGGSRTCGADCRWQGCTCDPNHFGCDTRDPRQGWRCTPKGDHCYIEGPCG